MKKIILLIFALLFIAGCSCSNKKETITDQMKFKEEYESLNGKVNKNGKEYVEISVPEDNLMVYATYDEIVDIIKNKDGVIYFGFPECPWCRNAVPALIDAANELGIDKIYYFNALSIRDTKKLDENGNIVVEKEGTNEYKKLVELLYDYLPVYDGLGDDTIKRLYFPTVIFVKDGKVIASHMDTVETQTNPYKKLSEEEYEKLVQIYSEYINDVYEIYCDDAC